MSNDFDSLEQAKELLKEIGDTSNNIFTENIKDDIENQAINDERAKFCCYVSNITTEELLSVQPLFYRKVISKKVSATLRRNLKMVWGIGQYWYPIIECANKDIIAFQDKYFKSEFGFEQLKNILQAACHERIFELRETGTEPEYEMDTCVFEPTYNGLEGFWFSEKMDWVIYASHESSITIGGIWLIEQIKTIWPNWKKRIWDSPFFD